MKKIFSLILLALLPIVANAYSGEAVIDGIKYLIVTKAKIAEVRESSYSGNIVIPSTVEYDGVTCNVTSIGTAFRNCSELTSVTIPNSVTSIDNYAFEGCSNLTSITIGNSVTSIGNYAFLNCSSLITINIPEDVTSIGYGAFQSCSSLTSITIPEDVSSIGGSTFRGCSSLTSIIIPNNVTSIGNYAFYGCSSMTTVYIGSSVKSIGEGYTFANCPELTDVYCYAEQVPKTYYYNIFENSYIKYATLHVPEASIGQYKGTSPWSQFGTIVAIDENIPEPPTPSEKCATPTISYANGKLTFKCETEDAVCQSTISDTDIASYSGNEVQLCVTYTISVYATKEGYANSDTATATLCWIDVKPQTEGLTDENATEIKALPVLIQAQGNIISVQGLEAGTEVSAYNTSGMLLDTIISGQETATLRSKLPAGSTAIVKIGDKAVKVMVK